jgi:hypothetical protein
VLRLLLLVRRPPTEPRPTASGDGSSTAARGLGAGSSGRTGCRTARRSRAAQRGADPDLSDQTAAFDRLDFEFSYRGLPVSLDVKEKRQHYSQAVRDLRPDVREADLFIVDETVFRRIVWQGGGGYLAIHDCPTGRWLAVGPWELTLGDHVRYVRWGQRQHEPFLKGKLLIDLGNARHQDRHFSAGLVLRAIDESRSWRDAVDPYPVNGVTLPELGGMS